MSWQGTAVLVMAVLLSPDSTAADQATGPLRAHATNGRYFADGSGKAIYLTGSHTLANLSDGFFHAPNQDPPTPFDYDGHLKLLQDQNHNFIRLWSGIVLPKNVYDVAPFSGTYFPTPLPYPRTGVGMAQDGKPKFDLSQFNQSFFDRLRSRVIAAGNRGIYVGVMLFDGWQGYNLPGAKGWDFHPFNLKNNINAINGDANGDGFGKEVLTPQVPAITDIQKAYVRKVVDTVNDLDNVLFEIANEAGLVSVPWQYQMIDYVRQHETTKPKQHPVGMTFPVWDTTNAVLTASSADWISLGPAFDTSKPYVYISNPPAAEGKKVSILDSDHLFYSDFIKDGPRTRAWVWKSFARGHNPILMEDMCSSAGWIAGRAAMGHTRTYANKMNLAAMTPQDDLASPKFCLANPGKEYLVYQPRSGAFTVNLPAATYHYEWFNPTIGTVAGLGTVKAPGGIQSFTPPFSSDAVLYLTAETRRLP